jgi:hypothetical protein
MPLLVQQVSTFKFLSSTRTLRVRRRSTSTSRWPNSPDCESPSLSTLKIQALRIAWMLLITIGALSTGVALSISVFFAPLFASISGYCQVTNDKEVGCPSAFRYARSSPTSAALVTPTGITSAISSSILDSDCHWLGLAYNCELTYIPASHYQRSIQLSPQCGPACVAEGLSQSHSTAQRPSCTQCPVLFQIPTSGLRCMYQLVLLPPHHRDCPRRLKIHPHPSSSILTTCVT